MTDSGPRTTNLSLGPLIWFLLAIAGQLASVVLVRAGNAVGYQHYDLLALLATPARWIAVVVLVLQSLAVAAFGRETLRAMREWLSRNFRPMTAALLIACVVLTAATISRSIRFFGAELLLATFVQFLALATLLSAVRAVSPPAIDRWRARFDRLLGDDAEPRLIWRDPIAARVALWSFGVAAVLAFVVYQRHPHIPDEVSYLLQARYFARGMIAMPLPPVPEAFNLDLMTYEPERWFSPFPPGWPVVLALGVRLSVPWLVNPALNALCVLLACALLSALHGRRTARLGAILLGVSPWFIWMGMNLMSHALALAAMLAAALGVAAAEARGRSMFAWLGGLACGVVSIVRPLEGLAVAAVVGFWSLGVRGRRFRLAPSVAFTAGTLMSGALVLPYNRALTGSSTTFPVMAYMNRYYPPGSNDLGFGPNRGLGWVGLDPFPGHGALDVLVNANFNLFSSNIELFGWSIGSLGVLAAFLLSRTARHRRSDRMHVSMIAVVIGMHSFYWFSGGPDFGARYWYLILVPCVALTARAIDWLGSPNAVQRTRTQLFFAAAVASAMVVFVPWRAIDKYWHYRGMRPDVRELAAERGFGRSIVFVRGQRHPDFASAATYNPIDLTTDAPVYVWDSSPLVHEKVLRAYPDRPVWILEGPSITKHGFRVGAGPLPAANALPAPAAGAASAATDAHRVP